jgi:hypothetical protein
MYALEEHEKANVHSSSSSNGISSTVFQGFIFPFERSNEGPEPFPWLVECFFGRRGMVGENGLLPQGKFLWAAQRVVCSCLAATSAQQFRSASAYPRFLSPRLLVPALNKTLEERQLGNRCRIKRHSVFASTFGAAQIYDVC